MIQDIEIKEQGAERRILELLLMIVTSVFMATSINLLTGIIDSWSRNEFAYDPLYLMGVIGVFVITCFLMWRLIGRIREVEYKTVCQFLIDKTQGEAPCFHFENHKNEAHFYKPQTHLASAFVMMQAYFQIVAMEEKYGHLMWMFPLPAVNSDREARIRQRIKEAYTKSDEDIDNPVSDLFDCVIVQYLQDSRYMAETYGISEKKLMIIHDRSENAIGGFKSRAPTEEEAREVSAKDLPSGILDVKLIATGSGGSRNMEVRIPQNMVIDDISSGSTRGMRISGGGVELAITHKHIRYLRREDTGLVILTPSGEVDCSIAADQYELCVRLKMKILGYIRDRERFTRLVRWAEEFSRTIRFEFDWPSFVRRNRIANAIRLEPKLPENQQDETDQASRTSPESG